MPSKLPYQHTTGHAQYTLKTTTGIQLPVTGLVLGPSAFADTGMYDGIRNYNPYTIAPNSAHILWTKPDSIRRNHRRIIRWC